MLLTFISSLITFVLVYNESSDEHLEYLEHVLRYLRVVGLTVNPDYVVFVQEVSFLGHRVFRQMRV